MTDGDQFKIAMVLVAILIAFGLGVGLGWDMTVSWIKSAAVRDGRGIYHTDGKTSEATFYWVVP